MIKCLSTAVMLFFSLAANAQDQHTDSVQFCHGVGQAVGMIQSGRASGVEDSDNDAVQFIVSLSEHTDTDLLPSIDRFIKSSSPLPSSWTQILFTHACLYNYVEDLEHIKRISRELPFQCNVSEPDIGCLNSVLARIEGDLVI